MGRLLQFDDLVYNIRPDGWSVLTSVGGKLVKRFPALPADVSGK